MAFCRHSTLPWMLLALYCGIPACASAATTPTMKLTATNVSMGDRGSGTSQFTLTSLNGFTGQVNVECPNPIFEPLDVVLPICSPELQGFTLTANGSVSGKVQLNPPSTVTGSVRRDSPIRPRRGPLEMPIAAGGLAAASLLGLKMRRSLTRGLGMMLLAAAGLVGLGSMTACIGQGGLAMTPGSYTYTIAVENSLGQLEISQDFTVTITQ